jgi:hypothetical protein
MAVADILKLLSHYASALCPDRSITTLEMSFSILLLVTVREVRLYGDLCHEGD